MKFEPKKIVETYAKEVLKMARGHYTKAEVFSYTKDTEGHIWVESPYQLAPDMEDIIRKSKHGYLVGSGETPGTFDWESDTYIKDVSWVVFKIRP